MFEIDTSIISEIYEHWINFVIVGSIYILGTISNQGRSIIQSHLGVIISS